MNVDELRAVWQANILLTEKATHEHNRYRKHFGAAHRLVRARFELRMAAMKAEHQSWCDMMDAYTANHHAWIEQFDARMAKLNKVS